MNARSYAFHSVRILFSFLPSIHHVRYVSRYVDGLLVVATAVVDLLRYARFAMSHEQWDQRCQPGKFVAKFHSFGDFLAPLVLWINNQAINGKIMTFSWNTLGNKTIFAKINPLSRQACTQFPVWNLFQHKFSWICQIHFLFFFFDICPIFMEIRNFCYWYGEFQFFAVWKRWMGCQYNYI